MGFLKRLKGHLSPWPRIFRIRVNASVYLCLLVFCLVGVDPLWGEVLTPPYFNLAQGRRIYASATCGESAEGYPEQERYCNLVGATTDTDFDTNNVIHGQFCGSCEKGVEGKWHPAEYAIDGSERWWQSPPLSRGVKFNEINLTIDLGQEFHVAYVNLKMANSPRPGVWVLERSSDGGKTFKPWQYFAENPNECTRFFGKNSTFALNTDDGVICDTTNSKVVPLENGEIFIKLLEGRPSKNNFFASEALQEWTRATHVRLSFRRTKTLLGHLMSVSRQDTTVTRRYFYSVKGIEIGGRCRCNGHADICPPDNDDPYKLLCSCRHNTCGPQCESCCGFYVAKAWRVSTNSSPFVCEACNCFGHTNECEYDEEVDKDHLSLDLAGNYEGGGVCKNCRHNTEGINCDKCTPGYFRPYGRPLDDYNVCQPCNCFDSRNTGNCEEGSGRCECDEAFLAPDCDACNVGYYDYPTCKRCDCNLNGTRGEVCEVGGGNCPCRNNFAGQNCDQCADGFYNFPDCFSCECEESGSVSPVCDPTEGQCECANNYGGRKCNECENGYFNFPTCSYCNCDVQGTVEGICDKSSGTCLCRDGYGGARCDQCVQSWYGYPECKLCNCSAVGSASTICDATGKCPCLSNFSGRDCGRCTPGYYQFPECLPCSCHDEGSMGVSCDDEGKCQCKRNFEGLRCEECLGGFYNFPLCEECNCDPAGTKESFGGCADSPPGELCQCKDRVEGRICNVCKPLFWNLQQWNPTGCEDCDCFGPGIIGGVRVCENKNGQCPCKNNVANRRCEKCQDGFYNLTANDVFGCQNCGCDVGGSVNGICDKESGQCPCRPRIEGLRCTAPLRLHYFPTLFQKQYEAEDGYTPAGGKVRFGYDNDRFPDYSWSGYAIYTTLQPETHHDVVIDKPSLYLIVLRYNNPGFDTIMGEFRATPDNPADEVQFYKVKFDRGGGFLTVSISSIPTPFVLNPGRWVFSIKTDLQSDQHLLVDYFTILPSNFYEGTVLSSSINDPCSLNTTIRGRANVVIPESCVKFKYPSIDKFDSVSAVNGYASEDKAELTKFYSDKKVIDALDINDERMAVLSNPQPEIHLDLQVSKGGRYAILLEYFTPQGANLTEVEVKSISKKGPSSGIALIHNCKLAFLCRQVVTTPDGEVAIFRFDSSTASIVLQASPSIDPESGSTHLDRIAINSVTAVPLGRWSLDHITPRQFCIMKNETCINSIYDLPPDYVKVEAESGDLDNISPADSMPDGVTDKNLILLDSQKRVVEMNGKVPSSGHYTILVHYYQPENPEFSAEVLIQNGQHYQAKLPLVHCPSTSGCRAQILQEDKNTKFYITDNFMVTIKSPKNVWIDYILLVPSGQRDHLGIEREVQLEKYLEQSPLDDTRRFIAECGKNHFYLSPQNVSTFCKNAVFSISADYNNGALPCQCDYYGSTAFECGDQFGGQCPCRDNVIGRRCEKCRTGFYGFPDCKPCDCPSTALCDSGSGACICPPRVTGEKCDVCEPYTYGFDALIGCDECDCSPLGVENGDLQCDLNNGHCTCKPNIVGRNCSKCQNGHWAFPYCQICDCDVRGTTDEICSPENSACHCKANAEGKHCEQCKSEHFDLQENNPLGCKKCFCFGKTTRCSSAYLVWNEVTFGKPKWTAVAMNPASRSAYSVETGYELDFEDNLISDEDPIDFAPMFVPEEKVPLQDENNVLYFRADVNANQLASVGGRLRYVLISEPNDSGDQKTFSGPDVIIEGRELAPSTGTIRLLHFAIEHLDGKNTMNMDLTLSEENFVVASHSSNGGLTQATRDQLMIVLKGLKAIYVRAGYWMESRELRLQTFTIDSAIDSDPYRAISLDERAVSVEQCQCPPNYQGFSCEECSPGYYRSPNGTFGGHCVPCQCHGHSNVCDPISGICLDCQNNSTGDNCEFCQEGFHGDATGGTPYDCLICACPIPIPSNNFATQCEVSDDGRRISCNCKDGYIGPRCEACGPGFYGRPEVPYDYCKPCSCSGNIDSTDPSSCDTVTGACLRCMNDTGGAACELCAPGFYGDALLSKNCRKCDCSECGTHQCDNTFGDCKCLNNVVGVGCSSCRNDYYGLGRCDGQGCHYCDCGIASASSQCDDMTGQCECKKGTTGRRCERCAPGYWNYTEDGCESCECNSEYAIGVGCDPGTGQCSCLPGVVGEKCDRCPWRWVLIEDQGCKECGSCHHQLLDVTDLLAAELNPVMDEFENVAVTYFTTQKLTYFNETVNKLRPNVQLMDPSKADLGEYYIAVDATETNAATQRQKAELIEESLTEKVKQAAKLLDKSLELESKVREASLKAENTVQETQDWVEVFAKEEKPTSSPQAEQVKAEAEAIFDKMQQVKFENISAIEENDTVTTVLKDVKAFVRPLEFLSRDLSRVREQIGEVKDKFKDLKNESDHSIATSRKANDIGRKIKDGKFSAKIGVLDSKASDMIENMEEARELNKQIPGLVNNLTESYANLGVSVENVKELQAPLSDKVEKLLDELRLNENTVSQSQNHARQMKYEADGLQGMLDRTKAYSDNAIAAATSYETIVDSLEDALASAEKGSSDADSATEIINNLHSSELVEPSRNQLVQAENYLRQVEYDLKIPLRDAKSTIDTIEGANNITSYSLNNVQKELDKIESPNDMSDLDKAITDSTSATKRTQETQENIKDILETLPTYTNNLRKLRLGLTDLNSGTGSSDRELNQAKDSIPLSNAITGGLEEKRPSFEDKKNDVAARMSDLKAKIAAAREQANRVYVGMNLNDDSSLLLANPQSLESQQAQTKVSFFFRTADDGLIFYLGNEPGRKEEDFMTVEVDRGYPVLTIDLGSGPQRIMNDKYVADNQWYKATVDRSGKTVRFIIAEEDRRGQVEETVKEDYLQGSKSLFNVDRNSSKLYIGGLPPGVVRSPVRYSTYRGSIEDLVIGDEKVGLWNFKDAQNVAPALERDKFIDLHAETGLRFQGNGYAILDRTQFPLRERSAIGFQFKTRAKNGLIFLVGRGKKYMAIYMADGNVVFQYDLGGGPGMSKTSRMYNDGQWHTAETVRSEQNSYLTVDSERINAMSPGSQTTLPVGDYMYFGGYPGEHNYPDVSNREFEGCLKDVTIDSAPVDLTQAVETRYTVVGCPSSQYAPTVATFFGKGFVKVSSADSPVSGPVVVTKDDTFELNFRFRTNNTDGFLFYGSNGDQSNWVSVALFNGSMEVQTEPGQAHLKTDLLNDAGWHVVTITRDRSKLVVNVDDTHEYVNDAPNGPIQLNTPGSTLLFGGRPEDFTILGAIASEFPYTGCLADISINGNRLDFTDSVINDASVAQKCFTPADMNAMSLERDEHEANGRRISQWDEDDDSNQLEPMTTTMRTTTSTTTKKPEEEVEEEEPHESDEWKNLFPVPGSEKLDGDEIKPTPYMSCALPYRLAPKKHEWDALSMEEGVMFGNLNHDSRLEFKHPSSEGINSKYSIDFKTISGDGLIFMWTDFDKTDYIALFMKKGVLFFAFDSGAAPAFLNSTIPFNDGNWHTASISRYEQNGNLSIDGIVVSTGTTDGATKEVNAGNVTYVGGLPSEGWSKVLTKRKLLNVDSPFKGCLRNLKIRGISPSPPINQVSVEPCSENMEQGFFFYPNSGFLKLSDQFKVGRHIKLSMSIKPRHPSGILVSVQGDRDFMVLQLINGTVKFTVDSGKGQLSSSYTKEVYDLCDGNWHTIQVTKSKSVVMLALDNLHTTPGIGAPGKDMTNTNGPLFVGGHPNPSRARGIETTEQFVGCMKDFIIEGKQLKLNHDSVVGTVGFHSCPTD